VIQDKSKDKSLLSSERRNPMEFWIGLSIGMHLGKVIANYLERYGLAYGLLSRETVAVLDRIEELESNMAELIPKSED
jgi:hypothetical protein